MGTSDSLEPYMTGYGKRLPRPSLAGHNRQGRFRVSRFSCMEFLHMLRVSDSAASKSGSRFTSLMMLPSPRQDKVGTPK